MCGLYRLRVAVVKAAFGLMEASGFSPLLQAWQGRRSRYAVFGR